MRMSRGIWLRGLGHDASEAWRGCLSSPAYAVWVIGSLATEMAVTIAALALLNAFLILPFPEVTEQSRLVRVAVSRNCGRPHCWVRMSSPADYRALRDGLTGLQGLAAYTMGDVAVSLPEARSMRGAFTSAIIGLLVGSGAAAVVSRWIQSEYHGIRGLDSVAFGGAAAFFLAAMLLASAIPLFARRDWIQSRT